MSRVLLFTGEGKGKTTAAFGMALRASGHGLRTFIGQFVKTRSTGELQVDLPGVEVSPTGLGFVPDRSDPRYGDHRAAAQEGLRQAAEAMAGGKYDLVVLDEVCVAVAEGLLDEDDVCHAVRQAAADCTVVMTGRGAVPALIDLADTVTDMRRVKHAFDYGVKAQKGVEF
jgi:cob(I)alamin adenosyltransferase